MKYFAFGSNMLSYRLEKRIGKVQKIGIGILRKYKLTFEKLSKDGSSKADITFTDNNNDLVYGVIYEISDKKKEELDKFEGNGVGYDTIVLNVERLGLNEKLDVQSYKATKPVQGELPYHWYKNIIYNGAIENDLPTEYIRSMEKIQSKGDTNFFRASQDVEIMKESQLIRKLLSASVDLINEINKSKQCTIHLPNHALNNKKISIEKEDKKFSFNTESNIIKGLQTHKELEVKNLTLTFSENGNQWFVDGKHFLIDTINYDDENLVKILGGSINSLSSLPLGDFSNTFIRVLIPIKERLKIDKDYQCYPFVADYKVHRGLMQIKIADKIFDFYSVEYNEGMYLVVDCDSLIALREFQFASNSILLCYALLSGHYHLGEAYYCSFSTQSFDEPQGILYHSLSDAIYNLPGVYTTNPYIGADTAMLHRDAEGRIDDPLIEKYQKDLNWFPSEVFSKMCDFTFANDKILRTLILVINNSNVLEIKIPSQYVALETITSALLDNNKELKPIENDKLADELKRILLGTINQFAVDHKLEEGNSEKLIPLRKKIETLNTPPNADKLSKIFEILDYSLTTEERKIISMRNKFLHGSSIAVGFEEEDFKELFYISLRVHFLIAALILKKAGFSGRIINYAKLYEFITDKYLDEEIFVKI